LENIWRATWGATFALDREYRKRLEVGGYFT
jgi:hypothetical protein